MNGMAVRTGTAPEAQGASQHSSLEAHSDSPGTSPDTSPSPGRMLPLNRLTTSLRAASFNVVLELVLTASGEVHRGLACHMAQRHGDSM